MKKNLLSIIIIALLIMNLILTSIMMFNVLGTSNQTAALVSDIATVLNLELGGPDSEQESEPEIPMSDVDSYSIPDSMTILLRDSENADGEDDGKDHYAMISVVLYMNKKDEGYKKYRETLNDDVLKSLIVEAVGEFTVEEFRADTDAVYKAILDKIQKEFDSQFIFKVAFSDRKVQ